METFADVLHHLIDVVFHGELADKAHDIIDRASGARTATDAAPEPVAEPDPAPAPADTPTETADPLAPGA